MSSKFFGLFLTLGALVSSVGCASLQSVSVTNMPTERARPIEARATNTAFLGLHVDNNFADSVPEDLRRQCPAGKVTGVYAKYETTWYVLVEKRAVTAKAYCEPREIIPAPPPAVATHEDPAVGTKANGGST